MPMYRGHIPNRKNDPEPSKDTAMSFGVAAFFVGAMTILILSMLYC